MPWGLCPAAAVLMCFGLREHRDRVAGVRGGERDVLNHRMRRRERVRGEHVATCPVYVRRGVPLDFNLNPVVPRHDGFMHTVQRRQVLYWWIISHADGVQRWGGNFLSCR